MHQITLKDLESLPPLLRVDECAALLRIGRSACYESIRRGVIPAIRISPRRLVVPTAALLRVITPEPDVGDVLPRVAAA